MKTIDLHTHSSYSDGTLTPSELVLFAAKNGLSAIALTDHDTINGTLDAIKVGEKEGVEVIVGIELSAYTSCELHILGLFIDYKNEHLNKKLDFLISERNERNAKILEKLSKLNIVNLDLTKYKSISLTRAHIARELVEKGYCKNTNEAYEKYIGFGKEAYVKREKMTPAECINLIHQSGGKAFLAHLNQIKLSKDELYLLLCDLKDKGLDGIEALYFEYNEEWESTCIGWADELHLLMSGGSDFHGENKKNTIGTVTNGNKISYDILERMKKSL